MKKIARILSLTLALLMVISIFAACGAESGEKDSTKDTAKVTDKASESDKTNESESESEKGAESESASESEKANESETDKETEEETDPVIENEAPEMTFINWNDKDKYTLTGGAFTADSGSKFLDGSTTTRVRTTSMTDAKINVEYTFKNKKLDDAAIGVLLCSQRMGTTVEVSTDNENWTQLIKIEPTDNRLTYDYLVPGTTVMDPCDANWNILIYKVGDILTAAKSQKIYVRLGTRSMTKDVDYTSGGNDNTGADTQIGIWFYSDPVTSLELDAVE